ncbi:MAG: hypothetical protein GX417_09525 [Clostridiales bacterium]|nr:hypothetical protein [Clostridiales bacterium]
MGAKTRRNTSGHPSESERTPTGGVPFVIGVTGHRDLRSADIPALKQLIRQQMTGWMDMCPHTEFFCMTSLAEGADQLCGRVASDLGMKLLVPLPMEQAEYEKDFSDAALGEFRALLDKAVSVFVAPDTELLHDRSREYGYRMAGIYLTRHCHVLLALWDGQAGESGGCGTAETVDFKLKKAYRAPDTLLTAPDEGIVLQIVTPRVTGDALPDNALTVRLIENAGGALCELLRNTEAFHRDAADIDPSTSCGVFDAETTRRLGPAAEPLQNTYRLADALALRYRDRYLAMLKWLCGAGALLVVAFLFYDEFEANLFLIAYGLIALTAFFMFLGTTRGRCHRKYIEYRLFAETLRVQLNLMASGLDVSAEDLMPWSQRTISPWIREAMNTLPRIEQAMPEAPVDVRAVWIREQLNYQKRTHAKNQARLKRQSAISGSLLAFTILFFVAVLVLEFLFPAWIGREIALPVWLCRLALTHSDHFFNARSIFKILLGIIPALTFVVSSYYGKLSLERKLRDGQRMIALYSEALEAYDNPLTDKARLMTELAREELVETGDWLSYVSENRPDLLI